MSVQNVSAALKHSQGLQKKLSKFKSLCYWKASFLHNNMVSSVTPKFYNYHSMLNPSFITNEDRTRSLLDANKSSDIVCHQIGRFLNYRQISSFCSQEMLLVSESGLKTDPFEFIKTSSISIWKRKSLLSHLNFKFTLGLLWIIYK